MKNMKELYWRQIGIITLATVAGVFIYVAIILNPKAGSLSGAFAAEFFFFIILPLVLVAELILTTVIVKSRKFIHALIVFFLTIIILYILALLFQL